MLYRQSCGLSDECCLKSYTRLHFLYWQPTSLTEANLNVIGDVVLTPAALRRLKNFRVIIIIIVIRFIIIIRPVIVVITADRSDWAGSVAVHGRRPEDHQAVLSTVSTSTATETYRPLHRLQATGHPRHVSFQCTLYSFSSQCALTHRLYWNRQLTPVNE